MDIIKEYEDLYEHWLEEFDKPELTSLPNSLLQKYKKVLLKIDDYDIQGESELQKELYQEYKHNAHYLFDDLLEIRKRKIMNSALSLQELDINLLFEGEKILYQNLVASIKDYQKEKSISPTPEKKEMESQPEAKLKRNKNDKSKTRPKVEVKPKGREKVKVEKKDKEKRHKGEVKSIQESQMSPSESISQDEEFFVPETEEITSTEEPSAIKQTQASEEQVEYLLLRFLKNTPSLVGADLRNYGPFKKEDIAYLPYQNGIILVKENLAEIISLD